MPRKSVCSGSAGLLSPAHPAAPPAVLPDSRRREASDALRRMKAPGIEDRMNAWYVGPKRYEQGEGELNDTCFDDKHLNGRLFRIMDAFAETGGTEAGDCAQAKAMYRYMEENTAGNATVLANVKGATVRRIKEAAGSGTEILLLQNTASMPYRLRDSTEAAGSDTGPKKKEMDVLSCIAVAGNGLPLGLVHQECRTEADEGSEKELQKHGSKDGESSRRITELCRALAGVPSASHPVTVCDLEGDFYELFAEASGSGHFFLVRLAQDSLSDDAEQIFGRLKKSEPQGAVTVGIGRIPRAKIPVREALLEYAFEAAALKNEDQEGTAQLPESLSLTAVYAREITPDEKNPVEWFLLTNVPVHGPKDAARQIRNYALRWEIARFEFALRNGFRTEKLPARSLEDLKIRLLLYSVRAMQLLSLTLLARLDPEMDAARAFDSETCMMLYRTSRKTRALPEERYALKEAFTDIGALGGQRGAPSDGGPGVSALWTGMDRLYMFLSYKDCLA